MVPALLSPEHQHKVDARAYSDITNAFGFSVSYASVPPGFFERVVVRYLYLRPSLPLMRVRARNRKRGSCASVRQGVFGDG